MNRKARSSSSHFSCHKPSRLARGASTSRLSSQIAADGADLFNACQRSVCRREDRRRITTRMSSAMASSIRRRVSSCSPSLPLPVAARTLGRCSSRSLSAWRMPSTRVATSAPNRCRTASSEIAAPAPKSAAAMQVGSSAWTSCKIASVPLAWPSTASPLRPICPGQLSSSRRRASATRPAESDAATGAARPVGHSSRSGIRGIQGLLQVGDRLVQIRIIGTRPDAASLVQARRCARPDR
jgi:hypothetical protein